MCKRISCLVLCLVMVFSIGSYALAAEAADRAQAETTETATPYFLVDGVPYEDPGMALYNGVTYVSMLTVMLAIRPETVITWEGAYAVATAPGLTVKARVGDQYIEANGRCLYVLNRVLSVNDRLLVPVRTIAQAMGAGVLWNGQTGNVEIYRGSGAIEPAATYYNQTDLDNLAHIINAESGNQPMEGKLAVGAVILNRVESPSFPNTIRGVVYAPNQFTPVSNGSIRLTPNSESVIAAKLCLEGVRVNDNIYYFVNPKSSPNSWASRNRPYVTTIGAHAFFA